MNARHSHNDRRHLSPRTVVSAITGYALQLRSSLWFAPAVLVLGAVALAGVMIELDVRLGDETDYRPLLTTSAEGARAMLAAIAGSMITVAGTVFSITIVTLSLASTQYSPRILRGFMRDATNQVVLGVFVGIFAYCIVVLGAIRTDAVEFVPSFAVLVGGLLSLVGIGFLIHFIHHTAVAIQASSIVANVAAETIAAIDRHYRAPSEESRVDEAPADECCRDESAAPDDARGAVAADAGVVSAGGPRETGDQESHVAAVQAGYLQRVDEAALREIAVHEDLVIRCTHRVGEFVREDEPLFRVTGRREIGDDLRTALRRAYTIGRERTVEQDPAWGLRQIADVAAKALSPAVNDATTATTCLDWLTAVLVRLSRATIPPERRRVNGVTRLVVPGPTAAELYAIGLDELRRGAGGNATLLHHLLRVTDTLLAVTTGPATRELERQLDETEHLVRRTVDAPSDRARLLVRVGEIRRRRVGTARGEPSGPAG